MKTPRPVRQAVSTGPAGVPRLPRQQRWLAPLLALAGLATVPEPGAARPIDPAPAPIARIDELRDRLRAEEARLRPLATEPGPGGGSTTVAQWKKWNDWANWVKWGKQG